MFPKVDLSKIAPPEDNIELYDLWDEYLNKFEDLRKEVFKNESFDKGEPLDIIFLQLLSL